MRQGQAWSADIMLALIVFLGVVFGFYAFLTFGPGAKAQQLEDEASFVISSLSEENNALSIIDDGSVDVVRLEQVLSQNYTELKRSLRIENDFCLYFEDQDGNVVLINGTHPGVGSSKINVSNTPCWNNS